MASASWKRPREAWNFKLATVPTLIKDATPDAVRTLLRLSSGVMTYGELPSRTDSEDDSGGFWPCLEMITSLDCVCWSIEDQGIELAKLQTIGQGFGWLGNTARSPIP